MITRIVPIRPSPSMGASFRVPPLLPGARTSQCACHRGPRECPTGMGRPPCRASCAPPRPSRELPPDDRLRSTAQSPGPRKAPEVWRSVQVAPVRRSPRAVLRRRTAGGRNGAAWDGEADWGGEAGSVPDTQRAGTQAGAAVSTGGAERGAWKVAGPTGFEPAISSVTGWHVWPLHHGPGAAGV